MSRRKPDSEISIGSDSFLDVIANIVGILIILIVIAGLRVGKAPVVLKSKTEDPAATPMQAAVEPEPPAVAASAIVQTPELPLRDPVVAPRPVPLSPELLGRIRSLEAKLLKSRATAQSLAADSERVTSRRQEVERQLQQKTQEIEATDKALQAAREQIARDSQNLARTQGEYLNLQWRLQHAKSEQTTVKTVEHRLTPISRVVDGKELHFELRGGRVAHVPLEELLERLRTQVKRQQDWLMKSGRHQGQVGPVKGYVMRYVVERQQLSVIDELRHGSGMVRIGISEWQLAQTEAAVSESLEEAVRVDSAFQQALRGIDGNTTLTFWVYPDSFGLYRGLQQAAHLEGYTVAGRPLPFGVPIAGSPQGSRSAGQ
jgi:hypothetical protein